MFLSFAPMEGVTSAAFRRVHRRFFPEADRYYSPFIAPDIRGEFKASRLRDVLGENNEGLALVPQILTNSAEAFLGTARRLHDLGYGQVDLNLGCPSATVVSKHKGAGLLCDPSALDALLADIFSRTPVAVSVKTRLGFSSTEEIDALMEIFDRYPICELTVHARCREGFYRSPVDLEDHRALWRRFRRDARPRRGGEPRAFPHDPRRRGAPDRRGTGIPRLARRRVPLLRSVARLCRGQNERALVLSARPFPGRGSSVQSPLQIKGSERARLLRGGAVCKRALRSVHGLPKLKKTAGLKGHAD